MPHLKCLMINTFEEIGEYQYESVNLLKSYKLYKIYSLKILNSHKYQKAIKKMEGNE